MTPIWTRFVWPMVSSERDSSRSLPRDHLCALRDWRNAPASVTLGGVQPGVRREIVLVVLLVAVAAFLRFWRLDQMEFKGDETGAIDLGLALLDARPWATAAHWLRHESSG